MGNRHRHKPGHQHKPPVRPLDDVAARSDTAQKSSGTVDNPPPPSDMKPPPANTSESQHGKPDQTPWWKIVLEASAVVVGIVVALIYIGQLRQMIESNRINRENMESVQRALVFFGGEVGAIKRTTGKKVTSLTLVFPWQNSGATPAMRGKSRVNWLTVPGDLPNNFQFPDLGDPRLNQFEIPPKGFGNGTADVSIEYIEKVKAKRARMFVWGWITYNDIFHKTPRHLSEFCDELTNIESSSADLTDPAVNIKWESSLCQSHNCSDERCADYWEKIGQ